MAIKTALICLLSKLGTFSKMARRGRFSLMYARERLMSLPTSRLPSMPFRLPAEEKSWQGGVHM